MDQGHGNDTSIRGRSFDEEKQGHDVVETQRDYRRRIRLILPKKLWHARIFATHLLSLQAKVSNGDIQMTWPALDRIQFPLIEAY